MDWTQVSTPALVLVGECDQMVGVAFTQRVVRAAKPPNVDVRILPGMGPLIFYDHLQDALPAAVDWLRRTLATTQSSLR